MSASNALRAAATGEQQNPVTAFRGFLEKQKAQLAAALPKHVSPDRMIRLACTEFAKNPLLQKCTPVSVFGAIIQSSQLGLEIGVLGQAYLVPYRNNKNNTYEAQFIPGYKGLISLARRSGEVTSIETNIVYANEDHTAGMDEIAGEADQRAMDLGHEYRENDGGGMDSNVIDAEFGLPAPGDVVTSQELEEAELDGYEAAADGKPESDCPVMKGALCIAWVKGWKEWHERNAAQEEAATDAPTTRYRHPDNANQTWTGRGRKPTWVVEWLENGGSMDDLLSDEE